jgi:hypothetical protein
VQFFVGTEVLVITGIASTIGVVLVVVWAAAFHREVLVERLPYAIRGGLLSAASSVVLLAWPAWFALAGPAHLSGRIWGSSSLSYGGTKFFYFVHGLPASPKVSQLTHQLGGYQGPSLSGQYLGFGLVAVLVIGLAVWHRDSRLWLFAGVGVVCAFLSVGLAFKGWTLWRLLVRAPLLDNIIPSRFVLVVYLCAAVMLGIVIDRIRSSAVGYAPSDVGHQLLGWGAGLVVAAVALLPIVSYFAESLPLTAVPVKLPEWFTAVAPDLPPHQVLAVFPFAFRQSNMSWQAVSGMPYEMVGGGGPNSLLSRAGKEEAGDRYLSDISFLGGALPFASGEVEAVRNALDGWGVTVIVLPNPTDLPAYDKTPSVGSVVALITAATGTAPEYRSQAWVWSDVDSATTPVEATIAQMNACTQGSIDGSVASVQATADCVVATATGH